VFCHWLCMCILHIYIYMCIYIYIYMCYLVMFGMTISCKLILTMYKILFAVSFPSF
jgi:hypothetical protein